MSIISPSGAAHSLRGFQSLSGGQTLGLRAGGSGRQHGAAYVRPRWCPHIDVLAVPEGRALRLVRMSGGKTVWRRTRGDGQARAAKGDNSNAVPPIAAIAWSPDGGSIAVLHADGLLVQRDSARGDVVHEARVGVDGRVAAMEWVACAAAAEGAPQPEEAAAALELALPRLGPLDRGQRAADQAEPEAEPGAPTALVITSASGLVCVCLGGILALPAAQMPPGLAGGSAAEAVDARLGRDLARLAVVLGGSGGGGPGARVCSVDTRVLAAAAPLLRALVPLSARLSGLGLYLEGALRQLGAEAEARDRAASRAALRDAFEAVLRDHGVDEATSPEAELCQLAVTGRASEPTSQFLLARLKAARVRSWESAGRLGAVALTRLVYRHAQPAVERTILAAARVLDVMDRLARDADAPDAARQHAEARRCVLRAIVVLGWLYARLDDCMAAVRAEQLENQAFADWALLAIDDLHWQNEGSRRPANAAAAAAAAADDADDGARPTRPETDYGLLLAFIHKAFRRPEDAPDQPDPGALAILRGSPGDAPPAARYFDLVIERANLGALGGSEPPAASAEPFRFVFHSRDLCATAPSCQEALQEARALVSRALEWPALVLGSGLKWHTDRGSVHRLPVSPDACSAMHHVSAGDQQDAMFVALVAGQQKQQQQQQHLLIACVAGASASLSTARLELLADVRLGDSPPTRVPVRVADLSFFDDSLLGIVFTVDGIDHPILGAVEYRSGAIQYCAAGDDHQEPPVSPLEFVRLQLVEHAPAGLPVALACNGAKGRRCVAVIDRGGRSWWPYDMDNEEEDIDGVSD
ncbi:hypothetical protein H4R18_001014 [Coemansia javaensis]|uniref:Anaphase-promoting complex subunit 4 n=1 Tax=Coemansia javaensis TaxID=2761396 RepID=A0A9W8HLX5_9FUNG|nr:hypothetical protein H4R18_001014 [Coemansia javaensis]